LNKSQLVIWFSLLLAATAYYIGSRHHFAPDAQILDLKFKDELGNELSVNDFQGQNTMLHFFAAWCAPCMKELPELNKAVDDLKALNIRIIGLSDDNFAQIRATKSKLNLDFEIYQLEGDLRSNGIPSIPTTFILNQQGQVVYSISGAENWKNVEVLSQIKANLSESF